MKPYYDKGDITLYCADARTVLRRGFDPPADLIFADPPFNAGKDYGRRHNDNMAPERYREWLQSWLTPIPSVLQDGGTFWCMNDTRWIGECQHILDRTSLTFLNMIVWAYTNPTPARFKFSKTWRPILLYCRGDRPRVFAPNAAPLDDSRETLYWNPMRAENRRFCHDLWVDVPKLVGGYLAQPELLRDPKTRRFAHLAQMPEALARRAILTATDTGDTVLDPFAGSGTVLKVARDLGRKAIGIEIEEHYCDLIVQRLTGN